MIDPEGFVTKSATLDTGAITGSASQLRTMGGEVKYRVEDVEKSWGGLGGCYEAPEQDRVYALMKPAADDAHGLNTVLRSAAGHLDTYAATLDGIKPRLADLERRARSFRSEVICGVRVDASEAKDASLGEKAVGLVDWVPGVDEGKKTVPWHEDPATAAKNSSLMKEYASLVEQVSSAAARCASDINALVERRQTTPSATTQAEALTDPGASLPWGSPATKGGTCPAVVGHGASVAGGGIAGGVGRIVGGVDLFDSETYGQAWAGATTVTGIAGLLTGGRGGGSQATSRGGSWTGRAAVIPVGRWAKGARDIGERTGANRVAVAGYTGAKGLMRMRNKIADDQAEWVNDKYKNHIAGLPPIQWSRAGLGATSDGLGAIETRAAWLARRTDSPFTANIPLATSRTASFFKGEVNRWDHILRDPKGWWDQASGLDKAGVAATFAPFGILGKGLVKGAKEALGLGKHADDVKKAPAAPKSPDSGDTGPGSGRSGSDGGPRKGDPDAPKKQGSDDPAPKSGSDSPDGGKPNKDGGGDRAGSTAKDDAGPGSTPDKDNESSGSGTPKKESREDAAPGGGADKSDGGKAGKDDGLDGSGSPSIDDGATPKKADGDRPEERQELPASGDREARPVDPEAKPRRTVSQKEAPSPWTTRDREAAWERSGGVDHRTQEPLRANGPNGEYRWHMKWDPEAREWVAENPGKGHTEPTTPGGAKKGPSHIGSFTVPDDAVRVTSGSKGNWQHSLYSPEPNKTYLVDDKFAYVTDERGRVKEAHGILEDAPRDGAGHRQTKAGGVDRLDGDEGGHIFGKSLGGPGEDINLLAMSRDANRSQYAKLENEWRALLKEKPPPDIEVTVRPVYEGASQRPSRMLVEWTENGVRKAPSWINN